MQLKGADRAGSVSKPIIPLGTPRKSASSSTAATSSLDIPASIAASDSGCREEHPDYAGASMLGFEAQYVLLDDVLGTGASGCVRRAFSRGTGGDVAVKSFNKLAMGPRDLENLRSEIDILGIFEHPNVVRLEGAYESESAAHLVMERLEGGDVFERLSGRRRLRESEAANIGAQTLRALAHLHAQKVAHRDVKPENLVFSRKSGDEVKLVDFGFSARVGSGLHAPCGSLGYVAPEVLSGRGYDERCDMWSVGCLLYVLMTGRPLFHGDDHEVLRQTRAYRQPDLCMEFWCLSEEARRLLRSLLAASPAKRPSAQEALQHPWFHQKTVKAEGAVTAVAAELDSQDHRSE